jgi:hypothetical protein
MNVTISIGTHCWSYSIDEQNAISSSPHAQNAQRINLQCAEANNIKALINRQKGHIFNVRDGKLCVVKGRFNRALYWLNKKKEQARVKTVVNRCLQSLEEALSQVDLNHDQKKRVLRVFLCSAFRKDRFGAMSRLPQAIYDRSQIGFASRLEELIDLDDRPLCQARDNLVRTLLEASGQQLAEKRALLAKADFDLRWAEARFADQLGLSFELISQGGSGGARVGRSRLGHKLVVIKPGDEGPYGKNTPSLSSRFKQWLLSPRSCLRGNSEPRAEQGSFRLSQSLGLDNVPYTQIEGVRGDFVGPKMKECSVQVFVNNATTLREHLNIKPFWQSLPISLRSYARNHLASVPLPHVNEELFEFTAVMKFLSGDIDTHFENILIKTARESADEAPNQGLIKNYLKPITDPQELDLRNLINKLYQTKDHYFLLDSLMRYQNQMLINHDGGASFVHSHPRRNWTLDSYLSGRFRFLFEIHPAFSTPFSAELVRHFEQKQMTFIEFAIEQAIREGLSILCKDGSTTAFYRFWEKIENRDNFKQFVLGRSDLNARIARDLYIARIGDLNVSADSGIEKFFHQELVRIHGQVKTLLDRYKIFHYHLTQKTEASKRELMLLIYHKEINQQLAFIQAQTEAGQYVDVLADSMNQVKDRPSPDRVCEAARIGNYHELQQKVHLLVKDL